MSVDINAEIVERRTLLRDLVALSTIPAAWVGREPPAVAAGLADTLIGLLQLDFVFVRLCDPGGAGTVDVTRGTAWERFPDWLERHLAGSDRLSGKEIIPDVGDGVQACRGVFIPIGVNGDGGVVVAASDRAQFPTETDQLLLSVAANHAATAFQSARLILERMRAEEELRKARDELEVTVAERTAELRRSEAYLAASRARIVAATDEERQRVVRDLHDGAQQRLVNTILRLKMARAALENDEEAVPALVSEALDHAEEAMAELRELAHGILPRILTHGGLRAGVHALASRMPVPVENGVSVGRLPGAVEATAYFVVAEALTNVAKHSHAGRAAVAARVEDGSLRIQVRDDGVGGARPDGSGLLGLADRLAVLDGHLRVESPVDGGTLVTADIPLPGGRS
jgi:signal transduction histidine kinase